MAFGPELKVCVVLLVVQVVLIIVTLAETYWFSTNLPETHWGLWSLCVGDKGCADFNGEVSWIKVPEALVCLSLVCAVGALALAASMMVRTTNKTVGIISAFFSMLSGILGIVGAVVYNHKVDEALDPAWCFYLNVVADSIMILVAIVLGAFTLRGPSAGGYQSI